MERVLAVSPVENSKTQSPPNFLQSDPENILNLNFWDWPRCGVFWSFSSSLLSQAHVTSRHVIKPRAFAFDCGCWDFEAALHRRCQKMTQGCKLSGSQANDGLGWKQWLPPCKIGSPTICHESKGCMAQMSLKTLGRKQKIWQEESQNLAYEPPRLCHMNRFY